MNKNNQDTLSLGITYQMSLDSFLKETHHALRSKEPNYEEALSHLKEMKKCRSWSKKKIIAQQALLICEDCIEAYLALGLYTENIFETLKIYKEGMELATINLGKEYFQQDITDFYTKAEAQVFFHMKFAYASALYEMGFMRKAQIQFKEIVSLNPSDALNVRYYMYALHLYFEEYEHFKALLDHYPKHDTFTLYANFLYYYKRQYLSEASALCNAMQEYNHHLYDVISFVKMNTITIKKAYEQGSCEEAAYCYAILKKVLLTLEYLPSFLIAGKQDKEPA